ncbi:hypothetical protein K458DRAFT_133305 [Lentithecium fluviatile CBS 122367]|uniref:Secreted protein n=1 Tax=Lentithecium fluviatile CBS 122367 TaxID=1168545 RepID=A0A6G1IKU1_9PLEO|nr:hypothetical protein K458DRAFT_133305 [Lentithecium fluviatile CBS 122367]
MTLIYRIQSLILLFSTVILIKPTHLTCATLSCPSVRNGDASWPPLSPCRQFPLGARNACFNTPLHG